MEYSLIIQAILEALALLLLYTSWRIISPNGKETKKKIAPEPSGSWPIIGHLPILLRQIPACKTLAFLSDKLGPIYSVRFGCHRLLVVSHWETIKQCLTINDRTLATRANIAAGKYLGYNNAVFALAPYGDYWRDLRKLTTLQLFSNHRLEKLKHVRLSEVDTFINNLYNRCAWNNNPECNNNKRVSLSSLIEQLTLNINLRMIVGKRFDWDAFGEENSEVRRYKEGIKEATYLSGVFVLSDAIPWLEWLDFQGYVSAMKRTSRKLDQVIEGWVEEHVRRRRERGESNGDGDFMDLLMSNLNEGGEMSGHPNHIVIKATTLNLTLNGAGSTAISLTWALSLLLNNPTTLKAAQEELDIQVGKERWVQESDIENLKYLQAVVKETFRLYPPGPLTGIREAMEDCYIGGYYVPKGTRLVINIWKLHRDPEVWENPEEFRPERFLTTHSNVDVWGQNFEYLPFSSGRRGCPAIAMGMQVVYLTLARILQGFDLATFGGLPVDLTEGMGIALAKVRPLEVVINPRLSSELY